MAFELGELLSEARIFTQRFLLGIFFPTFGEILFLYVLFLKEIPDDLTGLFLLAGLATGIALVLERGAGRLIWTLAICGGHYSRHYTKHFGVGLKSELKEESSSQTVQERHGLILKLDLLIKYLNEDLTLSDDKREALIETTKDLREKIEYGHD